MHNKQTKHSLSLLSKGFTLIELLIVITIVAILASVALPSYQKSVQKSRRADAVETLTRLAVEQEQFFSQNNSYTTSSAALGTTSTQGYYDISANVGPTGDITTSFTLTASANTTGGQDDDTVCAVFTLNSQNTSAPSECW